MSPALFYVPVMASLAAFGAAWARALAGELPPPGRVLHWPDMTLFEERFWRALEMWGKALVVYWEVRRYFFGAAVVAHTHPVSDAKDGGWEP